MFKEFMLLKAMEATNDGKYIDAYHFIQTHLSLYPKSVEGCRIAGMIWAKIGAHDRALNHYQTALDIDPDNIAVLMDKGKVLMFKNDAENARKCFRKVIAIDDQSWEALRCYGQSLFILDRSKEASEMFERSWQINPMQNDVLFTLYELYVDLEDFNQAQAVLFRILWNDQENLTAYEFLLENSLRLNDDHAIHLAQLWIDQLESSSNIPRNFGTPQLAIDKLQEELKILPNNAILYYLLGLYYYNLGDLPMANIYCSKSLEILPDYLYPQLIMATIVYDSGDRVSAISNYEALVARYPNSFFAVNDLGELYRVEGDFESALKCLRKALQLNPIDINVLHNLGRVLEQLGRHEEALEFFNRVLVIDPLNIASRHGAINVLDELGQIKNSTLLTREYNILDNKYVYHLHKHANELRYQEGSKEMTELLYRTAIEYAPDDMDLSLAFDRFIAGEGSLKQQIKNIEANLQESSDIKSDLKKLVDLYHQVGDRWGETHYARFLLEHEPDDVKLICQFATALNLIQENTEAEQVLANALNKFGDDSELLSLYGVVLLSLNRKEESKSIIVKTLSLNPNNVAALNTLAVIKIREEKHGEAEAILKKAIEIDDQFTFSLTNLASLYFFRENDEDAIPLIEQALKINAKDAKALALMSGAHYRNQEHKQAKQCALSAIGINQDNLLAYRILCKLSEGLNPEIISHLYMWELLSEREDSPEDRTERLILAARYDLPMLTLKLSIGASHSLEEIFIDNAVHIVKKQMQIAKIFDDIISDWSAEDEHARQCAAIIHYLLGDVTVTYQILQGYLTGVSSEYKTMLFYYYSKATADMGMDVKEIAGSLLQKIDEDATVNWATPGIYYLALLNGLADYQENAATLLRSIVDRFVPARYQLGIILQKMDGFEDSLEQTDFLKALQHTEIHSDFNLALKVEISGNLETFIDEFGLVMYCLECQEWKRTPLAGNAVSGLILKLRDVVTFPPVIFADLVNRK